MKSGEIDYLKNIGPQGSKDAFDKPFSDATRPKNLVDIGVVMALLPQPPARILDLGCGTGWTSWFLAKSGYDVVGQDIAQDMIDLAVRNGERYGTSSAKFVVSDYESAGYSEEFDAALFYDSLHHAEDERAAIRCAFRALKPGGALVTHEPGRGHFDSAPRDEGIRRQRKGYAAVAYLRFGPRSGILDVPPPCRSHSSVSRGLWRQSSEWLAIEGHGRAVQMGHYLASPGAESRRRRHLRASKMTFAGQRTPQRFAEKYVQGRVMIHVDVVMGVMNWERHGS